VCPSPRQLLEGINERDAERPKVTLVGGEDGKAAHGGSGGDFAPASRASSIPNGRMRSA
jgi:hypothetical protein